MKNLYDLQWTVSQNEDTENKATCIGSTQVDIENSVNNCMLYVDKRKIRTCR